jgi:Spy/CpxP family protein refolding chaperone
MNKISKGVLALALGMAMSGFALAQSGSDQPQGPPPQQQDGMRGQGGPGGRRSMPSPEERLKRMTADLNLTSDQQAKIKTIMESEKTKMDALRDDTSVEGDAKREKMMSIRKDTQSQIRAVLTADQQAKFDKQQEEMRNRRRGDGPPPDKPQNQ